MTARYLSLRDCLRGTGKYGIVSNVKSCNSPCDWSLQHMDNNFGRPVHLQRDAKVHHTLPRSNLSPPQRQWIAATIKVRSSENLLNHSFFVGKSYKVLRFHVLPSFSRGLKVRFKKWKNVYMENCKVFSDYMSSQEPLWWAHASVIWIPWFRRPVDGCLKLAKKVYPLELYLGFFQYQWGNRKISKA